MLGPISSAPYNHTVIIQVKSMYQIPLHGTDPRVLSIT